ncbi:MAG: protein translocase subunit SecD [Verrucomicrobia bacterium]|nr:protein translocase subunit SecD [Verrucomicrobiota bacterium]
MPTLTPALTFLWGCVLLFLLFFYLGTTDHRGKKLSGTILTVLMSIFCVWAFMGLGIKKGIDIGGGSSFTVQLKPGLDDKGAPKPITKNSLEQAIAILEKRLNPNGENDLLMTPQGEDRIHIEMPGVKEDDKDAVRKKIEEVAQLELRIVHPDSEREIEKIKTNGGVAIGYVEMPHKEIGKKDKGKVDSLLVKSRADLAGKHVSRAIAKLDPQEGWVIGLYLDSEGSKTFDEIAARHRGDRMAIVLDGVVISDPVLKSDHYGGYAQISGGANGFKQEEAIALATALENPLENPMVIIESSEGSAAFGAKTVEQAIYTGIVGTVLIALFMLIYYRLAGVVALCGVVVNLLMIFGAMALFKITLTMPGIAGIALTVGMGVDANVLIYERLREEMRAGKSLATGLATAFEKAFAAIFDVHVTTLITSLILFSLASGLVKGFAVTLIVGIFGTLFGALIVTRVVFGWFIDTHKLDNVKFAQFIPTGNYDVLKYAKPFIIGSFALAFVSLAGFVYKPNHGIGIDFRGGAKTQFAIAANEVVTPTDAETALKNAGLKTGTFYVQENTTATGRQISVRSELDDKDRVKSTLENAFVGKLTGGSTDTVGSVVGSELAQRSIIAFVVAMVAILIYLSFFYEFSFALGAIIALFHDCIIVVGLSVLMGQELSIIHIGAVLTVAGYSINDTIIVFDRIREMIKAKGGTGNIRDIMNEAISITLSRTLLTSLTALMPMVALYIFGGPSMKEFSLPILIGIIVGTYSSIYIASPLVLWYAKKTGKSLHRQVLDNAERAAAIKPTATA